MAPDRTFALKVRKIGKLLRQLETLESRECPALSAWWGDLGVGAPANVGATTTASTGIVTQQGSGSGFSGTADQFQFHYKELTGDGYLTAKVTSVTDSDGTAAGGLMIRNSTAANSAFASLTESASGSWTFSLRGTPGGLVSTATYAGPSAQFAKLVRNGPLFSAYVSANGQDGTWTLVGTGAFAAGNTVDAGTAVSSLGSSTLASAVFENLTIADPPPVGANLEGIIDWSYSNAFVDMTKQSRAFMTADGFQNVAVDANGWPLADSTVIFQSGLAGQAHIYNGTYKLSFTGQATIDKWVTPGTVTNIVYNAATNTTTADVNVTASESADFYIGLVFRNSKRTASSATGSGVTNIKFIRPGFDPNNYPTFNPQFTDQLKGFTTLRFMDWLSTNNSTVVNWSDRTPANYARQTLNGVAWEYVVQLCNQLGKDAWINIPAEASADYVTNLATFLKNNLNPDRAVYVEWSNEVWNYGFQQNAWNSTQAVSEVQAGTFHYNYDGETNQTYWAWRRVGEEIKEVSDIFRSVWGDAAMNTRVRCVLADQAANPETFRQALQWISSQYGDPSHYLYALAGAPYFSIGSVDNNTNLTVDQVIAALQSAAQNAPQVMEYAQTAALAADNGLKMLAYEGGPDTTGANNIPAKAQSQLDPRMKQIVINYLTQWFQDGGGLFNWFTAGATNYNSPYGSWGLTNDITNPNTPKAQGIAAVLAGDMPAVTGAQAVPGEFSSLATVGSTTTTGSGYAGPGNPMDYLLSAPTDGAYTLKINYSTDMTGQALQIKVNGKLVQTLTLPPTATWGTYADSPAVTLQLNGGMNVLEVTVVGAGLMLGDLKLSTSATMTTITGSGSTLTATVNALAGSTATGAVQFYDGGTMIGSANLGSTGSATFTPPTPGAGNHIYSAVFVGNATFAASTSPGMSVAGSSPGTPATPPVNNSPATPPAVVNVVIGDGTAQRSMVRSVTVTFDRVVVLQHGAFTLSIAAGTAPVANMMTATINGRTVATLTFSGTGVVAGSLPDGVYTLRLTASKVQDAAQPSATMVADRVDSFYRLYGDIDGNRTVDASDYLAFRASYLAVPTNPAFDYDGNGAVDANDLRQFSAHYGRRI